MKSPLIFISHDHDEQDLASAWRDLLASALHRVPIEFFQSSHTAHGAGLGSEVRGMVRRNLKRAVYVLAVFTPQSGANEWMLWESGFADGVNARGKLIPIYHAMNSSDLARPIQAPEAFDGDSVDSVRLLLRKMSAELRVQERTEGMSDILGTFLRNAANAVVAARDRARIAGRAPSCGTYMRYYHVHLRARGTVDECRSGHCRISYIGSGLVESRERRITFSDRITGAWEVDLSMHPMADRHIERPVGHGVPPEIPYAISGDSPLRVNGEISGRVALTDRRRYFGLHFPYEAVTATFVVDMSACDVVPAQPSALLLHGNQRTALEDFHSHDKNRVWFLAARGVPAGANFLFCWEQEIELSRTGAQAVAALAR